MKKIAFACALLGGCSFIDNWQPFHTDPGADAGGLDGGSDPDAGRGDDAGPDAGRRDAGDCPSCADLRCANDEVCFDVDADGCFACEICDRCGAVDCAANACIVQSPESIDTCYCSGSRGPGEACDFPGECASGLICGPAGVCEAPPMGGEGQACFTDGSCNTGLTCVGGRCRRMCGTDADCADPFNVCMDSFCSIPNGGEWASCDMGVCQAGLECRSFEGYLVCVRACAADGDCPAARCVDVLNDGPRECVSDCDFVTGAGCPMGEVCRLAYFDNMATVIFGACYPGGGTLPSRSECTSSVECSVGADCLPIEADMVPRCYQWCYGDGSVMCTDGEPCTILGASGGMPLQFMGREVGICFTP